MFGDSGPAPRTTRLRSHPQARLAVVTRKAWVFDCAGCREGWYLLGDAYVDPDGSLRCWDCWSRTPASWCPGCERVLPFEHFKRIPRERGPRDPKLEAVEAQIEQAAKLFNPNGPGPQKLCEDCQRESRERRSQPGLCSYCGETFAASRRDARYCSGRCRVAAHRAAKRDAATA